MGRPAFTFQQHVTSFWKRVAVLSEDECWLYAKTYTKGYPTGRYGLPAHRFSYLLHKGAVPENLQILHSCDNPACVNPKHLSLGTQSQNLIDCALRGRLPRARFTADDVREIRKLAGEGQTHSAIARFFKTTSCVVYNIVTRKRWSQIN